MGSDLTFSSRRSPVVCLHGCVASSQPLASTVGLGEWTTDMQTFINTEKLQQQQQQKTSWKF